MKVLFVHDHRFYEVNNVYYSTKFSESTWKPYVMNGNKVTMYARRSNNPCSQKASSESLIFKLTELYTNPLSSITNYKKIKKELNLYVEQSDCVIVRMPSVLGIIAASSALKNKKKLMAEVVGDAYDAYKYYGNKVGKLLAPIFKHLNKKAIWNCDAVLYVTKDYLQKLYPTNGISCACSDVLIDPVPSSVLDNRLSKIDANSSTIVCGEIGNVSMPYKGYEVMLKAMQRLKLENIYVDYHIAGGGDPSKVFELADKYGVRKRVFYDGIIDHKLIHEFYDKLDIYVHPAFTEGLPRVVIEAISRGCPCVTSVAGGTPELIDKEFIHECGDYEKCANDIKKLINNKSVMKDAAKNNFENAKNYYSSSLESIRLEFYRNFYRL